MVARGRMRGLGRPGHAGIRRTFTLNLGDAVEIAYGAAHFALVQSVINTHRRRGPKQAPVRARTAR